MSPEMFQEEEYDSKSDIWSLGVLLYEMCALKHPFVGASIGEIALAVNKCEYQEIPDDYSDDTKKLIKKLLNKDPAKRPNINKIVRYPLIEQRAKAYLGEELYEQEYSHQGISGNVFDEFAKKVEAKKQEAEDAQSTQTGQ